VVFTLPSAIGAIIWQNKALIYGLLFKAASETMLKIAADKKHLWRPGRDHGGAAHMGIGAQRRSRRPALRILAPRELIGIKLLDQVHMCSGQLRPA
jgi:hypothetical protein